MSTATATSTDSAAAEAHKLPKSFKDCPSFPGWSASSDGCVWVQGRAMPYDLVNSGYFSVKAQENGKTKSYNVHSLVADAFLGPRPEGKQIDHKNGLKSDNSAANLRFVTPSENNINRKKGKNVVHDQCPVLLNERWLLMNESWTKGASVSSLGRIKLGNGKITKGSIESGKQSFLVNNKNEDGSTTKTRAKVDFLVAKYFVPHTLDTARELEVFHLDGDKNNNAADNLVWLYNGEANAVRSLCKQTANEIRKRRKTEVKKEDASEDSDSSDCDSDATEDDFGKKY